MFQHSCCNNTSKCTYGCSCLFCAFACCNIWVLHQTGAAVKSPEMSSETRQAVSELQHYKSRLLVSVDSCNSDVHIKRTCLFSFTCEQPINLVTLPKCISDIRLQNLELLIVHHLYACNEVKCERKDCLLMMGLRINLGLARRSSLRWVHSLNRLARSARTKSWVSHRGKY